MKTSKRLLAIAEEISNRNIVVDIGCDHAYLALYLLEKKIVNRIYLTDIHEGAFLQAKKNIEKYHYEDNIQLFYNQIIIYT